MTNLQKIFAKACNWHAPINYNSVHWVSPKEIVYETENRIRGLETSEVFDLNVEAFKIHKVPPFKDEVDRFHRSIDVDFRNDNYYITYIDRGFEINRFGKWYYRNHKNTFILNKHGMYNMKTKRYELSTNFLSEWHPFKDEIKERVLRNHPHLEWLWKEKNHIAQGYSLRLINTLKTEEAFYSYTVERHEHISEVYQVEQLLYDAWVRPKILARQLASDDLPF